MNDAETSGTWTSDRVEKLKTMWRDGLSAGQIAKALGVASRSAVIGKVHRLGLSGRAMPSKPTRIAAKPRPPKAPAVKKVRGENAGLNFGTRKFVYGGNDAVVVKPDGQPPRAVVPVRAWAALPGSAPRPWPTRQPRECRWPIDVAGAEEMHSCCLPAASRYCEAHERMSAPAGRSAAQLAADRLRAERMALGVVRPRRRAA